MEFRPATPDDAEEVQRVARLAWHTAYDSIIGTEGVDRRLEQWYDLEGLERSIDRDDAPMVVAVEAEEIVGFAQGGPNEEGPADAVVGRIYLHPDHWGNGGGTELLRRLFDDLRVRGCESVWLAVMEANDVGRSFYEKHGFQTYEKRTVEHADITVEEQILIREL